MSRLGRAIRGAGHGFLHGVHQLAHSVVDHASGMVDAISEGDFKGFLKHAAVTAAVATPFILAATGGPLAGVAAYVVIGEVASVSIYGLAKAAIEGGKELFRSDTAAAIEKVHEAHEAVQKIHKEAHVVIEHRPRAPETPSLLAELQAGQMQVPVEKHGSFANRVMDARHNPGLEQGF